MAKHFEMYFYSYDGYFLVVFTRDEPELEVVRAYSIFHELIYFAWCSKLSESTTVDGEYFRKGIINEAQFLYKSTLTVYFVQGESF